MAVREVEGGGGVLEGNPNPGHGTHSALKVVHVY